MANIKKLPIVLNQKEKTGGFIYLIFCLFFLPTLLNSLNRALPTPLTGSWVNLIYYVLNFAVLFYLLRGYLKRSMEYAGKHIWAVLGYCVLGFALYFAGNYLLSLGIGKLFPGFSNMNDSTISGQLSGNFWPMAIGTVLLVPLAEELMHRALVFGSLYPGNHITAYVVSMVFFAAIHVMPYIPSHPPLQLFLSFLQYLPAGWVLAWTYRRSGCIFVPILIHTVVNAMGVFALR